MRISPGQFDFLVTTRYLQPADRQSIADQTANVADRVAISETAKNLAAQASTTTGDDVNLGWVSKLAHSDPAMADQLLEGYTYGIDLPLVDISHIDMKTGTGAYYASTGEPVTEATDAWFKAEASRIREGRIAIYQSEKGKGTASADILDKVIQFMDSQPEKYLQLFDWQRVSGRTSLS